MFSLTDKKNYLKIILKTPSYHAAPVQGLQVLTLAPLVSWMSLKPEALQQTTF